MTNPNAGYDTYFTTEPKPSIDWKIRQKRWEKAPEDAKPTKNPPRVKYEENTGTAQPGLVAFLDYSMGGDELYIHFMSVRTDQRGKGYATAMVDWLYAKAKAEGRVVNWGKVFYPAELMLDRYREHYPETRGHRAVNQVHLPRTHVAHLGNDPEAVYHCPFCGSGALVGGPDGSVTCGVCERTYMVFIQPQFSGMPADQAPGARIPQRTATTVPSRGSTTPTRSTPTLRRSPTSPRLLRSSLSPPPSPSRASSTCGDAC